MGRICDPIPLSCDHCFVIDLTQDDLINVGAGLAPASTYYLWITDKFGNQYSDPITVNSDGSFDIDAANYPSGMFNPSAGVFDLFLSSDTGGSDIIPMMFNAIAFNCLKFIITCENFLLTENNEPIITESSKNIIL